VPVILDTELSSLTDRADAKAKVCPSPRLKRSCRITPRFDQVPAKCQYRRGAVRDYPERGAAIRADQLGANYCLYRMVRSIVLVAELSLRM
jgi:hypothetical protein